MSSNDNSVIEWLLASDPSIRWQVMRDLLAKPATEWSAERAKVETEGWGAALLAHQDADGQWAGGAYWPRDLAAGEEQQLGQPWTATSWALDQLVEFGLDPGSDSARRTVALVGANARWEEGGQPFWQGETEECINGRTVAAGAYLGADVAGVVARLLGATMAEGGWNCHSERGSVRASFASTLAVLEGLVAYERATGGGTEASVAARRAGEEYLLRRHLFRRLTTGQPADDKFLMLIHPARWRYDVLRALEYFRSASILTGEPPDDRLEEAVRHVRSKRGEDGRWTADWALPGRTWFRMDDGPGHPSPWLTLYALRVLKWWDDSRAK